ncbi:MAG: cell division protein ZapB [Magnetococcus sp. YQC-3]
MNLSEQQASVHSQGEMAMTALVPTTVVAPSNPLTLLETRLNSMTGTIAALKNKVATLQEVISHREQRISALEMENVAMRQQMDRYTSSHCQLMDGLTSMLARFPSEDSLDAYLAEGTASMDLMAETMGTA